MGNLWFVIRCQSHETLELAVGLEAVGIPSWTPTVRMKLRMPRVKAMKMVTRLMMPSFVFADPIIASFNPWWHPNLPKFNQMRVGGILVVVNEDDMIGMRESEAKARTEVADTKKKRVRLAIAPGTVIVMPPGPFSGRNATVIGGDADFCRVVIEDSQLEVTFSTFLLP